jgi:hypothetical protein
MPLSRFGFVVVAAEKDGGGCRDAATRQLFSSFSKAKIDLHQRWSRRTRQIRAHATVGKRLLCLLGIGVQA